MNTPATAQDDLHHKLDEALGQRGLLQEILLLRLIKGATCRARCNCLIR